MRGNLARNDIKLGCEVHKLTITDITQQLSDNIGCSALKMYVYALSVHVKMLWEAGNHIPI